MRIVYVLTSLGVGGAERQALALADRMAQRGHAVAVLVLRPAVMEEWPTALQVVHLDIRKSPVSVLTGFARARRFLREFRSDLLHSHCFHANVFARLLGLIVPSVKVISTVHNVYEGGWYRMVAYRLTDSLAHQTIAVSQAAADRFVHLKAVHARKCVVLRNGIDLTEFSPCAERRALMRGEMAVGSSFIWLAVGRMVPAKDFPNLLRAFNLVRAANPEAQLWIAGAAPAPELQSVKNGDHSGGDFAGLSAFVPGIHEQVHWLGLRRDMPALLDAADAFVQASAWEGMPLAVGEAMAMAKPVVATDAGGTREMVGDTAIIVPTQDSDALAAAMLDLMRQPAERRRTLGEAARTRIAEGFSMDVRANEWEALYGKVAGSDN
jgi:glycosyltransferase involved in cell wall biosynthesis